MLAHPKILTLPEFLDIWQPRRNAGQNLVFTNGCFDILHPGHVDLLARCRAEGDTLLLGLNSDDSVRRQNKGPGRPFNGFAERAFVLAHLAAVDFIVGFDQDTPWELIRAVRPQVLIKGGDWNLDAIVGKDIVDAEGGKVLSLPLIPGYSTTALAKRIAAHETASLSKP